MCYPSPPLTTSSAASRVKTMEEIMELAFDVWSEGMPPTSWIRLRISTMWEMLAARERGDI